MNMMILNNSVQENVNASRVVKAFVREDYEIDKFHGISKYVYHTVYKSRKDRCLEFTGYAVYNVCCYTSACSDWWNRDHPSEQWELENLTSIIVYALQIIGSLMMVTFVFVMIMIAEASTDRITEVLE